MNLREELEILEESQLGEYAVLAKNSKGRERDDEPCDIRTDFQRDRDRIIHSKAFRRLKHKTQVFISPEGDHYRTRLTHTLEVSQIARTIARCLRLNEDLTEAIALGHDLGHTPFGHAGERALNTVCDEGFEHHVQSIRVVEKLENKGMGLNLTWEVRDGIVNHQTKGMPNTLEGKVVQLADKIAYINHDIDDAIRGKILAPDDLPQELLTVLGQTTSKRLNNMIHDIVSHSKGKNDVTMSDAYRTAMLEMRQYMFEHVYVGSKAKVHEKKAENMLTQLFLYFRANEHLMPYEYLERIDNKEASLDRVVADYIAGMTDRYATSTFMELFVPSAWKD